MEDVPIRNVSGKVQMVAASKKCLGGCKPRPSGAVPCSLKLQFDETVMLFLFSRVGIRFSCPRGKIRNANGGQKSLPTLPGYTA